MDPEFGNQLKIRVSRIFLVYLQMNFKIDHFQLEYKKFHKRKN